MSVHRLPPVRVFFVKGMLHGQYGTILRWTKADKGRPRCLVLADGDPSPWDFPRDIMRVVAESDDRESAA